MMLALAVALGCDLFDSAAYALYARDGRYLTSYGTLAMDELEELPCPCPVCSTHTAEELRQAGEETLAEHNLYATFAELRQVKQAIRDGSLLDLLERRDRAHPLLYSGIKDALAYISEREPEVTIKGRSFLIFDGMSIMRPEITRFHRKNADLKATGKVLVTSSPVTGERENFDSVFGLSIPFGPYPLAMYRTYPIGQSVLVEPVTRALVESALRSLLGFIERSPGAEITVELDPRFDHPMTEEVRHRVDVRMLDEIPDDMMMKEEDSGDDNH
jgi:7-cyano-7-deazaguanine tRNA-ribosyltransferase